MTSASIRKGATILFEMHLLLLACGYAILQFLMFSVIVEMMGVKNTACSGLFSWRLKILDVLIIPVIFCLIFNLL